MCGSSDSKSQEEKDREVAQALQATYRPKVFKQEAVSDPINGQALNAMNKRRLKRTEGANMTSLRIIKSANHKPTSPGTSRKPASIAPLKPIRKPDGSGLSHSDIEKQLGNDPTAWS